jgi:hypothetical protein
MQKISSLSRDQNTIDASVMIKLPIEKVFTFYRDFKNLPTFLGDALPTPPPRLPDLPGLPQTYEKIYAPLAAGILRPFAADQDIPQEKTTTLDRRYYRCHSGAR